MATIGFLGLGEMGTPMAFKLRHAAKDLRLVTEAATARRRELTQAAVNRAWLDEAAEQGAADLDFSAVVATVRGERP
jgi:3-hydroxyisobutyrate dehydrogenase-like beta-hydroxyacid dehydrogenase